eukprot:2390684-Pyramimonas_sp.AAC.1
MCNPLTPPRAEIRVFGSGLGGLVGSPLRHHMVAARAGGRRGGQQQDGRCHAPARPSPFGVHPEGGPAPTW